MISSLRNVHPNSHKRVSPLSNDERPCMCVTCASWETSPRLVWTWPSSVYMVDLDLSKSCLHWWCLDETVCFLQWEHLVLTLYSLHWDMETRVETRPGLCPGKLHACIWMSALRCLGSGAGWASLGDHTLLCVGFPGPPRGLALWSGSSSVPCQIHLPWGSWRPLRGYLVIIPISHHIQVE